MPELPEVETIRLFLQKHLVGKTITDIQILNSKPARCGGSFIGDPSKVIGAKILSFSRLGKQLSVHLSNQLILLIHLKMTGQIVYVGAPRRGGAPNKSTRVIFYFSPPPASLRVPTNVGTWQSRLFFNDQRKFGWIKIFTKKQLSQFQKNLGLDIFNPQFTLDYLYYQLHSTSRAIKLVPLDQKKFAGIGNIYANDSLFLAKIHPKTPSNVISRSKVLTLRRSLLSIMTQSITHGGSTAKDSQYLLPDGSPGSHQFHFQVYQRAGEPCRFCHTPIVRFQQSGRSSFFCPRCQPSS